MKKILMIPLFIFMIGSVLASCDYYTGDSSFNLPQISINGNYVNDQTHQTYLACLYNLDGNANYESMNLGDKCRVNVQSFNPNSEGSHVYNLDILYMTRAWNPTSHQWETTGSGTDNSLDKTFTVCGVPADTEGGQSFIDWIKSILCNLFGIFCPTNQCNTASDCPMPCEASPPTCENHVCVQHGGGVCPSILACGGRCSSP